MALQRPAFSDVPPEHTNIRLFAPFENAAAQYARIDLTFLTIPGIACVSASVLIILAAAAASVIIVAAASAAASILIVISGLLMKWTSGWDDYGVVPLAGLAPIRIIVAAATAACIRIVIFICGFALPL